MPFSSAWVPGMASALRPLSLLREPRAHLQLRARSPPLRPPGLETLSHRSWRGRDEGGGLAHDVARKGGKEVAEDAAMGTRSWNCPAFPHRVFPPIWSGGITVADARLCTGAAGTSWSNDRPDIVAARSEREIAAASRRGRSARAAMVIPSRCSSDDPAPTTAPCVALLLAPALRPLLRRACWVTSSNARLQRPPSHRSRPPAPRREAAASQPPFTAPMLVAHVFASAWERLRQRGCLAAAAQWVARPRACIAAACYRGAQSTTALTRRMGERWRP